MATAAQAASTPYPPQAAGSGSETISGSGTGAGVAFHPRFALVGYEQISGHYMIYLTAQPLTCAHDYLAKAPYLTVNIITDGSPLQVGAPSVQDGKNNFVQVDFFTSSTHYYSVQPHVRLVLSAITATPGSMWHGRLTVPKTVFEGRR